VDRPAPRAARATGHASMGGGHACWSVWEPGGDDPHRRAGQGLPWTARHRPGSPRRRPARARRRAVRLPRAQRRRQDHHYADARHPGEALRRARVGRRPRPCAAAGAGPRPARLCEPGWRRRTPRHRPRESGAASAPTPHAPARRPGPRGRVAGGAGAGRGRRPARAGLLRRPAAPLVPRHGSGAPAPLAAAGRADRWAGPAQPHMAVGRDPPPARRGHHRVAKDVRQFRRHDRASAGRMAV
jgi:hypothetical protein